MSTNTDYIAIFGEEPSKNSVARNASADPLPFEDDSFYNESPTGSSIPLEKKIETEQWIEALCPGVGAHYAPVKKDSRSALSLLSETFVQDLLKDFSSGRQFDVPDKAACSCKCEMCAKGKCPECSAQEKCANCKDAKSAKTAKMMKYDRAMTKIVTEFRAELGKLDNQPDEFWQKLIDSATAWTAESVAAGVAARV